MTMFMTCLRRALLALPLTLPLGLACAPTEAAAAPFDAGQTTAIEQIVRDYLLKNPEILTELREALANKTLMKTITENAPALFRSKYSFVAGNPKGDVTVVEFFDYNCGFCKRSLPALLKLIKSDDKVRVVLKELPIFGEHSQAAARVAIAAMKQGKYLEMHNALMSSRGRIDGEVALATAKKLGLDMTELKKDMAGSEVTAAIQETMLLAQRLGLEGTPYYLIGDKVIPGGPSNLFGLFTRYVAEVRKNGCKAVC